MWASCLRSEEWGRPTPVAKVKMATELMSFPHSIVMLLYVLVTVMLLYVTVYQLCYCMLLYVTVYQRVVLWCSLICHFKVVMFHRFCFSERRDWRSHGWDNLLWIEIDFINRSAGDQTFIDAFVNIHVCGRGSILWNLHSLSIPIHQPWPYW